MLNNYNIKDVLVKYIKDCINDNNIDTSTPMKIVTLLMEKIEILDIKFESNQKKEYIILTLHEIIKFNNDNNINSSIEIMINNNLISDIIDIICSASKGEININKIKKTYNKCYSFIKCV